MASSKKSASAATPSANKAPATKKVSKQKSAKPALESPAPLLLPGDVPVLFLDANVMLTQYVRACVLDIAEAGHCRVYWTQQVLDEVRRNLLKPKFGKTEAQADHLLGLISGGFPDALVTGWEPLEPGFHNKTHAGDKHVAAGALHLSQASCNGGKVILVTANSRHLPHTAFAGTAVLVAKPGTVLKELLAAQPASAQVLEKMLKRFKKPKVTKRGLLEMLDNSKCRAFAAELGKTWHLA